MLILTVFDIVAVILHYTNVLHFPMILTCFHALVGLSALLVIVANLEKRKKMSAEYKIIGFGLAELLLCGIIEVVRYNMQRYLYGGNSDFSITVLPFDRLIRSSLASSEIMRTASLFFCASTIHVIDSSVLYRKCGLI